MARVRPLFHYLTNDVAERRRHDRCSGAARRSPGSVKQVNGATQLPRATGATSPRHTAASRSARAFPAEQNAARSWRTHTHLPQPKTVELELLTEEQQTSSRHHEAFARLQVMPRTGAVQVKFGRAPVERKPTGTGAMHNRLDDRFYGTRAVALFWNVRGS
jgi:hypothetical protein